MKHRYEPRGFTLIELVLAIVILSVVGTGMLVLINNTTKNSADPQFIQQANGIARSYLEEVLVRPFCDPDVSTDCPAVCVTSACGACIAAEGSRNLFDDVCDYDGLSDAAGAIDQTGGAITGLEAFNVSIEVLDDAGADLNGLTGVTGQVVLVNVNVNVTHDDNQSVNVRLSGYRTNF